MIIQLNNLILYEVGINNTETIIPGVIINSDHYFFQLV